MTFLAAITLGSMTSESLWRARLRWRWRGALLWPLFALLTVGDALLLGVLPIAGDGGTEFVSALLLSFFFNLVAVAVLAPLAALVLRRRRPDLPKVVSEDYAGTALLLCVSAVLLAGGLIHRPAMRDAEHDMIVQQDAARRFVARQAPPEYRSRVRESDSIKLGDDYYRTCVPGPDPKRWFCVFVDTGDAPPGITVDTNRVPNTTLTNPGRRG